MVKEVFILRKVFYDDDAIDAYSDQISYYTRPKYFYNHSQRRGKNDYRNRNWDSRLIEDMQRHDRKYSKNERTSHIRIPVEISYKKYNKAHKSNHKNILKYYNKKDVDLMDGRKDLMDRRKNLFRENNSLYDELNFREPSPKFTNLSINRTDYSPVDHADYSPVHRTDESPVDRTLFSNNNNNYIRSDISKKYAVNSNRFINCHYYDKDDEKHRFNGIDRDSFNQNNFLNLPKPPVENLSKVNLFSSSFHNNEISDTEKNFLIKAREDKRRAEHNHLGAKDFIDNKLQQSSKKDRNEISQNFSNESLTSNNNNSNYRIKHYDTNFESVSFNFDGENNVQKKSLSPNNKHIMNEKKYDIDEEPEHKYFGASNSTVISKYDSYLNDRHQLDSREYDNYHYDSQQFDNRQKDSSQNTNRLHDIHQNYEHRTENSDSNVASTLFNKNKRELNENTNDVNEKQDETLYSVVHKPYSVYESKRNSSLNNYQNKTVEEKVNKDENQNNQINPDFNEKTKFVQPRKYNVTWQNIPEYESERKQSLDTISEKSLQNQNLENDKISKNFVSNTSGNSFVSDDNQDADENAMHLRRIYGNESVPYSLSRSDENAIQISKNSIDKDGSTTNDNDLNPPSSYQNKKIRDENFNKILEKDNSGDETKVSGRRSFSFPRKTSISSIFNFSKSRDSKGSTSNGNESRDLKGSSFTNNKRDSKSSIFSRKKLRDSKSSISNDNSSSDWKNQSFNGTKSVDSESSIFTGNNSRDEIGATNSFTDDQSEHEDSIDSNDECPQGRVLRNGRRESYRDLATRVKENTVYPTPTFSRFEVLPNTELSLSHLKPDHPPMFINRNCEQGLFVGDQGIQKDTVKSGAYAAIYCENCKQFVNKECGGSCKTNGCQETVGKKQEIESRKNKKQK